MGKREVRAPEPVRRRKIGGLEMPGASSWSAKSLPSLPRDQPRRIFVLCLVGAALGLVVAAAYGHYERLQMIETMREWVRLAPIPQDAWHFQISTEGNMFARAFRASFHARPEVIDRWLAASPGTREA